MKRLWLDELLKNIPNRFMLVTALVKRIRELEERKKKDPLFLHDLDTEQVAKTELMENKLTLTTGEEEQKNELE